MCGLNNGTVDGLLCVVCMMEQQMVCLVVCGLNNGTADGLLGCVWFE